MFTAQSAVTTVNEKTRPTATTSSIVRIVQACETAYSQNTEGGKRGSRQSDTEFYFIILAGSLTPRSAQA